MARGRLLQRVRALSVSLTTTALVLGGGLVNAWGPPPPLEWTQWISNSGTAWSDSANWEANDASNVVPSSTLNAILPDPPPGVTAITLGAGAQAKTLFVDGLGYTVQAGDLTLAEQLWIQQTGGSSLTLATGTISTPSAALGADAGKSGTLTISNVSGPAALAVSGAGTLTIGFSGGGSDLVVGSYGAPFAASVTAGAIQLGVNSTSTGNGIVSYGSVSTADYVQGIDGGSNTAQFWGGGSLTLTGASDLVLGYGANSDGNELEVAMGGSLSAPKNLILGLDGSDNSFSLATVIGGPGTATTGGARLGVNAGSTGNGVIVSGSGSTWSMNGTVYVGVAGASNTFEINTGGAVTLTGATKNFYVGSGASTANDNALVVSGTGSVLNLTATGADLVISGTSGQTGNYLQVLDGGLVNATRTLVGNGGTITGNAGVNGTVLVGTGGTIAPGNAGGSGTIGSLSFNGSLDLAPSISPFLGQQGRLDIDIAGTQVDMISVAGLLTLGGSTLHFDGLPGWAGVPYVFASYGTLSGTFGTIENMPGWMFVDYNYGGTNQIALVPEPSSLTLLGVGAACVAWRFRRRRPA